MSGSKQHSECQVCYFKSFQATSNSVCVRFAFSIHFKPQATFWMSGLLFQFISGHKQHSECQVCFFNSFQATSNILNARFAFSNHFRPQATFWMPGLLFQIISGHKQQCVCQVCFSNSFQATSNILNARFAFSIHFRPQAIGFDPLVHHNKHSTWATRSFSMSDNKADNYNTLVLLFIYNIASYPDKHCICLLFLSVETKGFRATKDILLLIVGHFDLLSTVCK
jgi:hypothetical protein